ncbi:hypothetical protein [Frankia sp. QA3]|uniref:hypothetical protein n=1 Tax=Frankia sp. QA3 TaxID=710111 RepID=UPI000269C750|nr:hypothetical protein [Frankia sp. QA3]EIV94856.1 hypothetical protein FraQA3DRAFT_4643 [Frankia sp. QA3]
MTTAVQILAALAVVANAAVFGTDFFSAVVLRPALAHVDDRTLVQTMGNVHRYGDKRLALPGTLGLLAAMAGTGTAAAGGDTTATVAGAVACGALLAWLVVFNRVPAPINRRLTAAVVGNSELPDARSLQGRSDGVLGVLVTLQCLTLIALCVMVAQS